MIHAARRKPGSENGDQCGQGADAEKKHHAELDDHPVFQALKIIFHGSLKRLDGELLFFDGGLNFLDGNFKFFDRGFAFLDGRLLYFEVVFGLSLILLQAGFNGVKMNGT